MAELSQKTWVTKSVPTQNGPRLPSIVQHGYEVEHQVVTLLLRPPSLTNQEILILLLPWKKQMHVFVF